MNNYFYGTGRRKTSIARVFLRPGNGSIAINGKSNDEYFTRQGYRLAVLKPLEVLNLHNMFDINIYTKGGGLTGQAEAIRLGIARALVSYNEEYRKLLKDKGLLTRDARMVERKKYGKPKARKSPQFSKR
ncbi:MAG: 30S ribosomal protein S9 [Deferribacterota bacterium]|nr:30S ribosomal protein S9 [Deferribacterota bacterium]